MCIRKSTCSYHFIDLEKAFDWVDRDLLLYAVLKLNIDGKVYFAIKAMYTNTFSCLKINNFLTEWFGVNSGVRRGDTLAYIIKRPARYTCLYMGGYLALPAP